MSGGGIAGILMIFLLVIVLFIAASCVKIVPQHPRPSRESRGGGRDSRHIPGSGCKQAPAAAPAESRGSAEE